MPKPFKEYYHETTIPISFPGQGNYPLPCLVPQPQISQQSAPGLAPAEDDGLYSMISRAIGHPVIFRSEKGAEMKTKLSLASYLILTFLTACQSITPTVTPTTAASIPISNGVVVSFVIDASDGMDDMSACLASNDIYRFVLYQDGRLIRFDGFQYVETKISQTEMNTFLSDIEATGFSSLSGAGDQYKENDPPPSFEDAWGGSVTVNKTTITVAPGQSDHLVEPVVKTLEIIEKYRPAKLQPYAPESVNLWVFLEESIRLGLANPTPEPPVLNWSVNEINLHDLITDPATSKPKVISGETLSFLMRQVKHIPVVRLVEQNRQIYLVIVCPNFA